MRRRQGSAPPALLSFFRELYFTNPFSDPDIPSLVYESQEHGVVGFLGGSVRRMSFRGQPIRVIFGGNLVVHPDYRSGLAAPRIISSFLGTQHDLSLTDSANDISRRILEKMGMLVPALNYHWRRPLRPGHYALYGLCHSTGPLFSASLKFAAKPLCSLADSMAAKLSASPFRQLNPRLAGTEPDIETLLQCFVEFRKGYSLWPEYDSRSLQWLLNFMERRPARGQLRKMVLRNEDQKIVGWYIYYVKPGAVGEVVQIGGDPKYTKDLLDHLFADAWQHGVIALHGVVDSRRLPDFSDKGCFFTCRGGWAVARTGNTELLKTLERGDACLSRLDGEWCLDPGD
ncbi:MAG TPA: hypothetical protein VFA67_11705 [Candidatus Sulfotelmatobacter sp.]|nr:hypothetical protein [Candidatus Sulfotelmatobacter sp.]